MNLCANDGQRLYDACMMGVFALGGIASVAGAGYAVYLLGAWGILGFVVFFLFLPIQVRFAQFLNCIPCLDIHVHTLAHTNMHT